MHWHSKLRAVIYPLLLIFALTTIFLGLALCLRNGEVPPSLINAGWIPRLAGQFGVQYSVRSLRVGCFLGSCRLQLDLSGVRVLLPASDTAVSIDSLHWCSIHPLTLHGFELTRRAAFSVQIGDAELSRAPNTEVRNISLMTSSGTSLRARRLAVSLPAVLPQDGILRVDSIDVNGLNVRLADSAAPVSMCTQSRAIISGAKALSARTNRALNEIERIGGRVRRFLFYVCLSMPAVLFLLKVWSLAWIYRWPLRLALGSAAVAVPLSVYWLVGGHLGVRALLECAFAASLTLAAAFWYRFYRCAARGYQRWEPFTLDVLSVVVVLPLVGYNFSFGTPLRQPTRFEIGRVTASDISLSGSHNHCGIRRAFAATIDRAAAGQLEVGLPDSVEHPARVKLARLEIPRIDVPPVSSSAIVDSIEAGIDWQSEQVAGVAGRFRFQGSLDAAEQLQPFRQISALEPVLRDAARIHFDVDLIAGGPQAHAAVLAHPLDEPQSINKEPRLAVRAGVVVDPQRCDVQYAWSAQLIAPQFEAVAEGAGSPAVINIHTIRASSGTAFQIRNGVGRVSPAGAFPIRLRLSGIGASSGGSQLEIASAAVFASTTPACSAVRQSFALEAEDAQIRTSTGLNAHIARADIDLNRRSAAGAVPTSVAVSLADVGLTQKTDGLALRVELPLTRLLLDGVTTREPVPRAFEGGLSFSVSTPGAVLENTTPLKIAADVRNTTAAVFEQEQVLRQSGSSGLPENLSFRLSAAAAPGEVNAHVLLPALSVKMGVIDAEIVDLEADVSRRGSERGMKLAFQSGWNRIRLPEVPSTFCFENIGQLDLSVDGSIPGLEFPTDLADASKPTDACFGIPAVPPELRIRVQGLWPSLQLEDPNGFGIRIADVSQSRLRSLDLGGGRFNSLKFESGLSGIQTLDGAGDWRVASEIDVSAMSTKISSSLAGAGAGELARLVLEGPPGRPDLTVTPTASLEKIAGALQPFLSAAGVNLDGIGPQAQVQKLHAAAVFDGSTLMSLEGSIDVGPGPVASIRPAGPQGQTLILSLQNAPGSAARLEFAMQKPQTPGKHGTVELVTRVAGLTLRASDSKHAAVDATLSLRSDIHGYLADGFSALNPTLGMAWRTAGNLSRQARNALRVFGNEGTPQRADLSLKLRLRNASTSEKALELNTERIALRLWADLEELSWSAIRSAMISGNGQIDVDLSLHNDHLVLDGHLPLRLRASLGAEPARTFELNLPVLVAFSDALKPAGRNSSDFWDSDYYRAFWSSYRIRQAARGGVFFNTPRLVAGGLSLRQVLLPTEPLQIALGAADRLELHVPFAGRALFGTAGGSLQTAIRWLPERALVSTNFNLQLRNIQAGAIGIDSGNGHLPYVEDELDGDISVHIVDWPLDRKLIGTLAAFESLPGTDRLSARVEFWKSLRNQSVPGILQLSSDTQLKTLNELLNRIIRDVRLKMPPRSVSYRNLRLKLDIEKGRISTASPWLTLEGLRIFSSPLVDIDGTVRLRGSRTATPLELDRLLGLSGP
jgi:hypothetical protein